MLVDRAVQARAVPLVSRGRHPKEALRPTKVSAAGSEQGLQFPVSPAGQGVRPPTAGPPPTSQRDEGEDMGGCRAMKRFRNL